MNSISRWVSLVTSLRVALLLAAAAAAAPRHVAADELPPPITSSVQTLLDARHRAPHYLPTDMRLPFVGSAFAPLNPMSLAAGGGPLDGTWEQIIPLPLPGGRDAHVMAFDQAHERMFIFGGFSGTEALRDTWMLDVSSLVPRWTQVATTGMAPTSSTYGNGVYDPVRNRLVVWRGNVTDELYALSLDSAPAVWSRILPPEPRPSARSQSMAVYDALHDRMLFFGGADFTAILSDLWALDFANGDTWTQLIGPAEGGLQRAAGALVLDAPRDRLVEWGGMGPTPSRTVGSCRSSSR